MDLNSLVEASIADTLSSLWPAFAPELILCASILGLLLIRLFPFGKLLDAGYLSVVGIVLALYFSNPWSFLNGTSTLEARELFGGMVMYDSFTLYIRTILLVFTVLFIIFTKFSGLPAREDSTDFYCLILGAVLGFCLMASANHLLMVFLAVEMASVPSYALAGIVRGRRPDSEAALKYSIYGAGAAGVMLYGISLLAGIVNTAHLPTIASVLATSVHSMESSEQMVLVLAAMMIMVGLAFKLSAVPFHFWCPDIFEGATAEIAAFLSIASKAAALALLVRVSLGVGLLGPSQDATSAPVTAEVSRGESTQHVGFFAVDDEHAEAAVASTSGSPRWADSLEPIRKFVGWLIGVIAVITCTFGNLAAYGQTNIKRLMAYSTIAHAGYMMLPVPAALAVVSISPTSARDAIGAIMLYIVIYMFMNLGAFAVIAFLRNSLGTEEISDYAGLIRRSPVIVVCFALLMFSLIGIPPLAGFVGKFALFAALGDAWLKTDQTFMAVLLFAGGLNTAISLFYYLRVVKVMTIDAESDVVSAYPQSIVGYLPAAFVVLVTTPILLIFVNWNLLGRWSVMAATQLFG